MNCTIIFDILSFMFNGAVSNHIVAISIKRVVILDR